MKFLRTFTMFFVGEIEIFVAGMMLITFGTIVSMSFSMNEFFGATVYPSRLFLTIFISMIIAGLSIQISNIKRLTNGYAGYVFSSIATIANSLALILEAIEMGLYGMSWIEVEFLRVHESGNSMLSIIGFLIFLFSAIVTAFSVLDLVLVAGGEN